MIVVSCFGAFSGVGVTHTCISIASSLAKKGYKVCVVDRNESNQDIKTLGVELGYIDEDDGDFYTHNKIDYVLYSAKFSLVWLRKENYDYVLLDCGTQMSDMCLQANQLICVSSSREWSRSRENFYSVCNQLDEYVGLENVVFVFPFANPKAKSDLRSFVENSKVYFPAYEENPFNSDFDTSVLGIKEKEKTSIIGSLRSNIDKANISKYTEELSKVKNELNSKEEEIKKTQALISDKEKEISDKEKEILKAQEEIDKHKEEADKQKEINKQIASEYEDKLNVKEQEILTSQKELEEKQRAIREEHFKATHDTLTGCKNRLGYSEDLSKFSTDNVVIVNFDVNNLKKTNDTLGHQAGDKLITTISKALTDKWTNVYRMGGDEFTVLADSSVFDEDVLVNLDEYFKAVTKEDSDGIIYQVAYGYEFGNGVMSFEEIYHNADLKMYEDKAIKKASLVSPEEKAKAEEMARIEEERRLEKIRLQELEDERVKKELEKQKLELERIENEKRLEEEKIRMDKERMEHERALEEERKRIEEERLMHEKALEKERKRIEEEKLLEEKRLREEALEKERILQEEKLRLEEERLQKEKEEQKRLELEAKQKYEEALNKGLIPETRWEEDTDFEEQEFEKYLCTMWFVKDKISFVTTRGEYIQRVLYIYPTDFEQTLYSTPLVVAMEDGLDYQVAFDDMKVTMNIAGCDIEISCRFQPDGKLQSNVYCPDVEIEQDIEVHNGIFTPRFFAKILCNNGLDMEVYPIKNNINGTCDCIVKVGDEINYNHGDEVIGDDHYRFYMNDKTFKIMID